MESRILNEIADEIFHCSYYILTKEQKLQVINLILEIFELIKEMKKNNEI